ncbi:ABC-type multidrug transport system, permease component [Thioflavicoccus mobilis 8321]|uniref:ABC-type multidrug transport system, permease component n=1 Tax=Thioflavicoccus mobilis 8321 TaxID=765912 RepID=L0GX95_9GAMM|nr:ABC transporter permease [Thioflavicoccus mobilis]AGA90452.1 ABC-type multidrug transport system, permease component [Thioflavicoccus mobilis 8321]
MGSRILALIVKELLALFRDKSSRFVVIGPPLIQLLVFGYAASYDLNNAAYAVYDRDGGHAARELLARFEGSPAFHLARRIGSDGEIAEAIDAREVLLVVQIDQRFTADLAAARQAKVQVLIDGRNSNTAQTALSYASEIVAGFNRDWAAEHGLQGLPVSLVSRAWYNPNLESRWFFVSGLVGILTLVVTMVVTAMSVAREREQGTFDQLLVTPLRPAEILIGKSAPGLLVGLFEASVVVVLAVAWFKLPLVGSLVVLYAGILLFLLAATGVGLMISSLALTLQQALLGAFLFMVPAVILSGFATPIANMPEPVQWLTLVDPLRYYLVIVRSVFLEGAGFGLLVHQMWPLAIIALVSLAAAGWLFRHRMA